MDRYDALKLSNQLCFPLYACSKEIISRYRPFLEEIDLTYTQYLVMMVLWEHESMNVKQIGEMLFLDSGTLTPVIKHLEKKDYVRRQRSASDERVTEVSLTESGKSLQDKALSVPLGISKCVNLTPEEAKTLYGLLYKILEDGNAKT